MKHAVYLQDGGTSRLDLGGTTVTRFVNPKGHALVDDEERSAAVGNAAILSEDPGPRLDEGSELTLVATPDP